MLVLKTKRRPKALPKYQLYDRIEHNDDDADIYGNYKNKNNNNSIDHKNNINDDDDDKNIKWNNCCNYIEISRHHSRKY